MDLRSICQDSISLASKCADFIKAEAPNFDLAKVEEKGVHDLVSYVDKESEMKLVKGLQKITPDAGFITEENTVTQSSKGLTWIIDPLDGTTNFVHGIPCYCISLALYNNGKPLIGIVHEICRDECFYAWENSAAYMNEKEIKVSSCSDISESLFATGFPVIDYSRMNEYMKLFDYCMYNTHGVRRLGSAAADLAYVACGRLEGFFEYGLNAWDVAAGAFIVQQAGGKNADFNGGQNHIFGREIVSCNSHIFKNFMTEVQRCFKESN